MKAPFSAARPASLRERRNALRVAEIVARNFERYARLIEDKRADNAEAVFNGTVGYVCSQGIEPEHFAWAANVIASLPKGGRA